MPSIFFNLLCLDKEEWLTKVCITLPLVQGLSSRVNLRDGVRDGETKVCRETSESGVQKTSFEKGKYTDWNTK